MGGALFPAIKINYIVGTNSCEDNHSASDSQLCVY